MKPEPKLVYSTIRDAIDDIGDDEYHIECRMDDGTKAALIVVDGDYPELANRINSFLNNQK